MANTVEKKSDDGQTEQKVPTRNPGLKPLEKLIGYDHEAGGTPSNVMTSRLYTNRGDTLSYTHEIDDNGVTSWFGAKGSPSFYKARWIDDNTLTGAWEWPGGGYKLTLSRLRMTKG